MNSNPKGDKIRYFYEANAFKDSKLIYPQHEAINKIGHGNIYRFTVGLHIHVPIFNDFSTSKEIKEISQDLGFKDPRILQSMLIFKMAKIGGEVPSHQDNTFIYTVPDSTIGFWYCMEDCTIDNGCMEFLPGSHTLNVCK